MPHFIRVFSVSPESFVGQVTAAHTSQTISNDEPLAANEIERLEPSFTLPTDYKGFYNRTAPRTFSTPDAAQQAAVDQAEVDADAADTEEKALLDNMRLPEKTVAKMIFDVVNDVRSRHGQGALTKAQFEANVLKPAIEWAKTN